LRERRGAVGLVALVAVVVAAATVGPSLVSARRAFAQVLPSVSISPSSGVVGSSFTLTPANFVAGCSMTYIWNVNGSPTKTWLNKSSTKPTTLKVPNYPYVRTYPIRASCSLPGIPTQTAGTRFTVTGPAPTTTTTSTTTTTVKTTTTTAKKRSTTTTQKGATTSSQPGSSTSSTAPGGSTTTTTTKPGTHHKKKITVLPSPGDTTGSTSTSYLQLTALAISPGAAITAAGRGCDHGSPVTLTIGSTQVGKTTAGEDGSFHAPLDVKALSVGRYDVQAACGAVLTASFDVVLASRVDPGTSTTMVIIVFFVLIGVIAFRRRLFPSRYPAKVKPSGPSMKDEV
jgi:hypothetical protein